MVGVRLVRVGWCLECCNTSTANDPVHMSDPETDKHLPGVLLMEGKFQEVCHLCQEQSLKGVLDKVEEANWAIALMNLGRFEQAGDIHQRLMANDPEISSSHVNYAICEWYQNRPSSALAAWTKALSCKYQSLGGGVEVAAMLYYASIKTADGKLEKKALNKLRKLWKPGLDWPLPIAGCLLNDISSTTLLEQAKDTPIPPALRQRYLCQAYFWQGFQAQRDGSPTKATGAFKKSAGMSLPAILEGEFYLAKWEIAQALEQQKPSKPWWKIW